MATGVGSLVVNIAANTAGFSAGLKQATGDTKAFAAGIRGSGGEGGLFGGLTKSLHNLLKGFKIGGVGELLGPLEPLVRFATNPIVLLGAAIGGLGAAALGADKQLREKSPGFVSPLEQLGKEFGRIWDEIGFQVLPIVYRIADGLKEWIAPTVSWLKASSAVANTIAYIADGFHALRIAGDGLGRAIFFLFNVFTERIAGVIDLLKKIPGGTMLPGAESLIKLGDVLREMGRRYNDVAKKQLAEDLNKWPSDDLAKRRKEIEAARAAMVEPLKTQPNIPSALERGSAAAADAIAGFAFDEQLSTIKDLLRVAEEIRDKQEKDQVAEFPK